MNDGTEDIDNIYDLIQGEFDHLDKQMGSFNKRRMTITDLPQLDRDLYLIHDIVAMTCNSGTGPWIQHRHEEPGWIVCAEEAFANIGIPQVSDGIKSYLEIYLAKGEAVTLEDDEVPSNYIMDHEHDIIRSLYRYLLKHNYVFLHKED